MAKEVISAPVAKQAVQEKNGGGWWLKRTAQCVKCPWRKAVNPQDIPNGYSEAKHRALSTTIADRADPMGSIARPTRAMACHELHDAHCVGWLHNQINQGNNVGLRIRMMKCENADRIRLRGEQHERFEDTLPPERP